MLASIVGIMKALDHSLLNEMRNEAVKIAQEQEEEVRNMNNAYYTSIPQIPAFTTPGGLIVQRQIRKTLVNFTVICTLPQPPAAISNMGARIVNFQVSWQFKKNPYKFSLQTIVRQMT